MKKLLKVLSLILSVVMAFSLFTACGEKEGGDETKQTVSKIVTSSRVDLYNFEQWKPDFACIKGQDHFGVVKRNKDKDYCKSGDYSCKILPIGGHIDPEVPVLWFPVISQTWDFNYCDFSYVDYVSMWLYNDNDVEKDVTIGLVSKYSGFERITKLQGQTYGLKPQQWTLIKYAIDFGAMSVGSALDRDDMLSIQGIYLQWDTAVSALPEEAPVYFLDDISLIYKETVNTFESPLKFDANSEIKYFLDFDEAYHDSLIYTKIATPISAPSHKVVKGKDVGIQPTTGSRMLQYNVPLMKASEYAGTYHWTYVPEALMRQVWKTWIYDSELANPYIVPRDEWKNWYICFDVYNASPFTYSLNCMFFAQGTLWDSTSVGCTMTAGQWVTYKTSVDHIASLSSTWRVYQGKQPAEYYLNEDRVTNPGPLGITYNTSPTKTVDGKTVDMVEENFTRMTYYIDSFRLSYLPQ